MDEARLRNIIIPRIILAYKCSASLSSSGDLNLDVLLVVGVGMSGARGSREPLEAAPPYPLVVRVVAALVAGDPLVGRLDLAHVLDALVIGIPVADALVVGVGVGVAVGAGPEGDRGVVGLRGLVGHTLVVGLGVRVEVLAVGDRPLAQSYLLVAGILAAGVAHLGTCRPRETRPLLGLSGVGVSHSPADA
jgi:hypothetical protein